MKFLKICFAVVLPIAAALFFAGCFYDAGAARRSPEPDFTAQPVSRAFTVIIDPGHGGFDVGASGMDTGVAEDDLNLDVSLKLKAALESRGHTVLLPRTDENAIAPTKGEDMKKRGSIMGLASADIAVSIHMNTFSDRSVKGPMVFYQKGAEDSCKELASCVIKRLCEAAECAQRLPNPGDYYVLRAASAPAVIVECGLLSNPGDEAKLITEEYRQTLALAIADGICDFAEKHIAAD